METQLVLGKVIGKGATGNVYLGELSRKLVRTYKHREREREREREVLQSRYWDRSHKEDQSYQLVHVMLFRESQSEDMTNELMSSLLFSGRGEGHWQAADAHPPPSTWRHIRCDRFDHSKWNEYPSEVVTPPHRCVWVFLSHSTSHSHRDGVRRRTRSLPPHPTRWIRRVSRQDFVQTTLSRSRVLPQQ